ncbi:MAG: glycosyltransferase [Actinomycetales bacterium]
MSPRGQAALSTDLSTGLRDIDGGKSSDDRGDGRHSPTGQDPVANLRAAGNERLAAPANGAGGEVDLAPASPSHHRPDRPVLDLVIPVYNEQEVLAASVRRVIAHLRETFPYPFRVTVADNASTDATHEIALGLQDELAEVRAVHLSQKGRGRALKQVWSSSDAQILGYLDVDLSTDLDALWPLVAGLMSGHSDVAIGSRLARGSRVVRGARREIISRCYNLILRVALGAGFTDAQCGFKAIRADVAAELLPHVQDPAWFFDTELLVIAQRSELRIHEVPVDWFDDPDSRVQVVRTATDDLRGVWRLHRDLARGRVPVADIADRIGRRMPGDDLITQVMRFLVVGGVSTVLHLGLFAGFVLIGLSTQWANLAALGLATVFNTTVNRRWTFDVRNPAGRWRHQGQGFVLTLITWALTSGSLALLALVDAHPATLVATVVVAAANVAATVVRFALMRWWVFAPQRVRRPDRDAGIAQDASVSSAGCTEMRP